MRKIINTFLIAAMIASCAAFTACNDPTEVDTATNDFEVGKVEIDQTEPAWDNDINDISNGISKTDDEKTGDGVVESDTFSLTLPNGASWDYKVVSPDEIEFYNKAARDADLGGILFTLKVLPKDDETLNVMPGAVVGEINGENITAIFTSDVQYDATDKNATKEYMEVYDVVQKISSDASTSPLKLK